MQWVCRLGIVTGIPTWHSPVLPCWLWFARKLFKSYKINFLNAVHSCDALTCCFLCSAHFSASVAADLSTIFDVGGIVGRKTIRCSDVVWISDVVPRTRRHRGNRAFCVAGPTAWYSLPPDINCFLFNYIQESTQDSLVYPVLLCNVIRVSYAVWRPCSDFMDMLRRLINCRIIIIINIQFRTQSVLPHQNNPSHTDFWLCVIAGIDNSLFLLSHWWHWPLPGFTSWKRMFPACLFCQLSLISFSSFVAESTGFHVTEKGYISASCCNLRK